jgi:hypothetical protein
MMLEGLMSRWRMPAWWAQLRAAATWAAMGSASSSESGAERLRGGGEGFAWEELHGEEEDFAGQAVWLGGGRVFGAGGVGVAFEVEGAADVGVGDFEGQGDFAAEAAEGFGMGGNFGRIALRAMERASSWSQAS